MSDGTPEDVARKLDVLTTEVKGGFEAVQQQLTAHAKETARRIDEIVGAHALTSATVTLHGQQIASIEAVSKERADQERLRLAAAEQEKVAATNSKPNWAAIGGFVIAAILAAIDALTYLVNAKPR